MKNKVKIENIIQENKEDVFIDHLVEMRGLEKKKGYFEKVHKSAIKEFSFNKNEA